jgi:hypothetical protein
MVESLLAVQVLGIPGWLLVALAALVTAAVSIWSQKSVSFVLISPHAYDRARGNNIPDSALEFMARLASKKGFGMSKKATVFQIKTNRFFSFVNVAGLSEEDRKQVENATRDMEISLPIVVLVTCGIDETKHSDGTPKNPGEGRRWSSKSKNYDSQ